MRSKRLTVKDIPEWIAMYCAIAKDCLLTLVKSRLALGSPGCDCSSPCQKWPNTQENGCWLLPSGHIQSENLFQIRQYQKKGMNGPASLLHSWRWVLFVSLFKLYLHSICIWILFVFVSVFNWWLYSIFSCIQFVSLLIFLCIQFVAMFNLYQYLV